MNGELPERQADVAQTLIRRAITANVMSEAVVERLKQFATTLPTNVEAEQWLRSAGGLSEFQLKQLALGDSARLRLGPYMLIEPLDSGGMGEVFRARHELMEREVALKTIKSEWAADQSLVQRFVREIINAARLSHPNIVTAHDAGEDDGTFYLAMEYLPGRTLSQVVAGKGQLAWPEAVEYASQAARGLAHAHASQMIHRDVKPNNLMLVEPGGVKVLDLGLSRVMSHAESRESLTATGNVMGTADYVAPEQARDAKSADARADIYSLGCTLYFLVTGEPPFPGGSMTEKMLRHLTEPAPNLLRLCDAPVELADLVSAMMAKSPADRPSSMDVVIRELKTVAQIADADTAPSGAAERHSGEELSPEATETEPFEAPPLLTTKPYVKDAIADEAARLRFGRGKRWIWLLAGLIGLATLGIAIVALWSPGQSTQATSAEAGKRKLEIPAEDQFQPREAFPDLSAAQRGHIISAASTDKQPPELPILMAFGWEDVSDASFTTQTTGVCVWDLHRIKPNAWLPTHGPVKTLAFAPNGQRLAAGTGSIRSSQNQGTPGGEIWIWKLSESGFERNPVRISAHPRGVSGVAWWTDRSGKTWLVSGGWCDERHREGAGVAVWDQVDGTRRADIPAGDGYGVAAIAVSNSRDVCVVGAHSKPASYDGVELQLWSLRDQSHLHTFPIPEPIVHQVSVSPGGDFALIATGYGQRELPAAAAIRQRPGRLYRWRLDEDEPVVVDESEQADITSVSFAANGDPCVVWVTQEGSVTWADVGVNGELTKRESVSDIDLESVLFGHALTSTGGIFGGSGLLARHVYPNGRAGIDLLHPPAREDAE